MLNSKLILYLIVDIENMIVNSKIKHYYINQIKITSNRKTYSTFFKLPIY